MVCGWLNWRTALGQLKEVSCRVALLKLHRGGLLRLPEIDQRSIPRPQRVGTEPPRLEPAAVESSLEALQPVSLLRIDSADSPHSRIWNELMNQEHYLGAGPLCGAQIRYLLGSGAGEWLGGLAFSASAWRVEARDRWIGWNEQARREHLQEVIANSRFLIRPCVRAPNLASHALGLALRRVTSDWRERYGYEPLLVETFVDAERFTGTCYQAANWELVGVTQGRGRQDAKHQSAQPVKKIWVYPLHRQARERLRGGAPLPTTPSPTDWAEQEFGGAVLGDERLERRLLTLARDFYARPQASMPEACQSRSKTKAAYRFFDHPETQMDVLLKPHSEATQQRIAAEKVVLAGLDTTSLNYSTHPATENLGPIGSEKEGIIGMLVHSTMTFNLEGTPLGLLDVQCWARDAAAFGQRHERKQRPIEEKESSKWLKSFRRVAEVQRRSPGTRLVSVGDRESDIYELFQEALRDPQGPWLLIRAEQDRRLAEGQQQLVSWVEQQPVAGIQEIQVPRHGKQAARVARLEVRFARVNLQPPKNKKSLGALTLSAVLSQEVEAPPGSHPCAGCC